MPSTTRGCAPSKRPRGVTGRYVGIGVGCVLEKAGLGPWEYARVEVDATGHVVVYSGVAAVGQGIETTLAQVVADELAVPAEGITVVHGDSAQVPFGVGGFASRGASVALPAALEAARKVRAKIVRVAATLLEADAEDLVVEGGAVHVRGLPDRRVTFRELSRAAVPGPPGMEPGLYAAHFFEAPRMTYPYGTHIAVVEVDVETGVVALRKYVITYDVGRAVNPMIVEGQLVGALGQGIGGALFEELVYDEQGQLLTTTLMDYLLPDGHGDARVHGRADPRGDADPAEPARRQGRRRGRQLGLRRRHRQRRGRRAGAARRHHHRAAAHARPPHRAGPWGPRAADFLKRQRLTRPPPAAFAGFMDGQRRGGPFGSCSERSSSTAARLPSASSPVAERVKMWDLYGMSTRLVNVRLDEERTRKARALRASGIAISDLLREAIDRRYEQVVRSPEGLDVPAIMRRIFEQHPDPPDLVPRGYDVHDRAAARQAVRRRLQRKAR